MLSINHIVGGFIPVSSYPQIEVSLGKMLKHKLHG